MKANRFFPCAALAALFIGASHPARAGQPHMEAALRNLQAARAELQQASANKGGERLAAISAIDRAIAEVRAGESVQAAYGQTHKKGKR